jgi:hypothetical protein
LLIRLSTPPKNVCSTHCAVIAVTPGLRGSVSSSRWLSSAPVRVRTAQVISVPPDVRLIQAVSGRRASASATAAAALGVHCTRMSQDVRPIRSGSTSPRTRSIPAERSRP